MQSMDLKYQSHDNHLTSIETTLRNQQAFLQKDNQVGQIAKMLLKRPQGSLPSNTEVNPREHVKAITLRSAQEDEMRVEKEQGSEKTKPTEIEEELSENEVLEKPIMKESQPMIPYPSRLKQRKTDNNSRDF